MDNKSFALGLSREPEIELSLLVQVHLLSFTLLVCTD